MLLAITYSESTYPSRTILFTCIHKTTAKFTYGNEKAAKFSQQFAIFSQFHYLIFLFQFKQVPIITSKAMEKLLIHGISQYLQESKQS